MSNASAKAVNGPTDLAPDELAERKRLAAVEYHTIELAALNDGLERMTARGADADKVKNQKAMIAEAKAALAAVEG